MVADAADQANQEMVDRLIAEGALWSPRLMAAFRATPRHRFLDAVFVWDARQERWRRIVTASPGPRELALIYCDRALITRLAEDTRGGPPVPISSSSQPSLMAQMLEDLRLEPGLRVLEVGAGTGYNAALLAYAVHPGEVVTVDVDRAVLAEARDHLAAFAERKVELHHADGRDGWAERAPYDRIMVTAATPDLEPAWLEQTAEDGLLLAPLVLAPGLAFIVVGRVSRGVFEGRLTRGAYFMPLRAEGETGTTGSDPVFPWSAGVSEGAPWASWFDHGPSRLRWAMLAQALAFFAWLRGLEVCSRPRDGSRPAYLVRRPLGFDWCWLGRQQWEASGPGGLRLARELWRAFLDAGAPRPTEFVVRAAPTRAVAPQAGSAEYERSGPWCRRVWKLVERRERPGWL
ncbi:MAG: methyltransferase domain-containing protein [Gemmataceae bacterium]|nr:methyltransferase domain-containing protein [Gemmataceae bacterium]MDW8264394.1 methyltransferase domain-containing protein [Gemmataceae bacterium]